MAPPCDRCGGAVRRRRPGLRRSCYLAWRVPRPDQSCTPCALMRASAPARHRPQERRGAAPRRVVTAVRWRAATPRRSRSSAPRPASSACACSASSASGCSAPSGSHSRSRRPAWHAPARSARSSGISARMVGSRRAARWWAATARGRGRGRPWRSGCRGLAGRVPRISPDRPVARQRAGPRGGGAGNRTVQDTPLRTNIPRGPCRFPPGLLDVGERRPKNEPLPRRTARCESWC